MAAWIDKNLENFIKESFPDRSNGITGYYERRTWQTSRYIQVPTVLAGDKEIYYEYYPGTVELHLEGKYQSNDYRYFAKELRRKTARNSRLQWYTWQGHSQCRCRIDCKTDSGEDVRKAFEEIICILDPIIDSILKNRDVRFNVEPYKGDTAFAEETLDKDAVCLGKSSLGKLFGNNLIIPDYQRNYCWEDKQIKALWSSLKEIPTNEEYHLGTIILQKTSDSNYAIIDGQQRLVTLSLIVRELHYSGVIPLLKQKFLSQNSKEHIANALWLIGHLASKTYDEQLCKRIINNLTFTVLILKESRLDLAYTFFSNENAKGIPLSDYDLLKAHHLRYIFVEEQAEHLATRWNNLTSNHYADLDKTLASHLYRLRKWMRKRNYNPNEKYRVKEEFSSAPILQEIPPFGERFYFYEKIQGGTHFFAYAEHFVREFCKFDKTRQVQSLRSHLQYESHWKYADVIETLLYGYFLKFGEQYLTEALFCIASNIAQHRYEAAHALGYKIREFANNSEIIMMIDQASSPTFFFAECMSSVWKNGCDIEEQGIAMRFYQHLQDLFKELSNEFTDSTIIEKYGNEYK